MADRYSFSVSGIIVQVQLMSDVIYLERNTATGTIIEQKSGTSNWFHFPIQTPTILDEDQVNYVSFLINADSKPGTVVRKVHVREGQTLIYSKENLNLTGSFKYSSELNEARCMYPIVISMFVEFTGGYIVFRMAEVTFNEMVGTSI